MTFDEFLRQESGETPAPVVTRIDRRRRMEPTREPRRVRPEDERELVDAEPHFPRIFPGI
ncbi:MAG TPA: hypothetical protein VGG57_24350 [Stellaceae bacterium]